MEQQQHNQQQNALGLLLQRYRKLKLIKQSKRKEIWLIQNVSQGERCIVKIQDSNVANSQKKNTSSNQRTVLHEANFLHAMQGHLGFPFMIWSGQENEKQLLLIEELGESIEDLFTNHNRKFSLKTVCMIGKQLLELVQDYHSMGYVHRRLLPRNLNLGKLSKNHKIYLNDLFDSKKYTSQKTNKHLQPKKNSKLSQHLSPFTTLNQLQCGQSSRRDDIETILLIMIYFLKGSLPWQHIVPYKNGVKSLSNEHKMQQLKISIRATPLKNLCEGVPQQFIQMLRITRALQFVEQPNYPYYLQTIEKIMFHQGLRFDYLYDWTLSKRKGAFSKTSLSNFDRQNTGQKSQREMMQKFRVSYTLPTIRFDDDTQLLEKYFYPFEEDVDVDQVTRRFNNRRLAQDDIVFSDCTGSKNSSEVKEKSKGKGQCQLM